MGGVRPGLVAPPVLCQVLVRAHVDVFQVLRCAANCEIPEISFYFANGLSDFDYGAFVMQLVDNLITLMRVTRCSVMRCN